MRAWVLAGVAVATAACRPAPAEPTPSSTRQLAAPAAGETPLGEAAGGGRGSAEPARASLPLAAAPRTGAASSDAARAGPEGRCVRPSPPDPPPVLAPGPAANCPADPEPALARLPVVRVTFPELSGVAVDAELARSEHDMARGLMYRKSMGEDRGMLFDLGLREDHKFWMHNTCIPLDLVFIDFDGLVVGIVENAPTLDDAPRGVGCASRWVLEVNAGWSRRHGLRAGQRIAIPAAATSAAGAAR